MEGDRNTYDGKSVLREQLRLDLEMDDAIGSQKAGWKLWNVVEFIVGRHKFLVIVVDIAVAVAELFDPLRPHASKIHGNELAAANVGFFIDLVADMTRQ